MDEKENIKKLIKDSGDENIKLPGENWQPFFPQGLYTGGNKTVFVTMENKDALAIMAADSPAVGIDGPDNYYLLLDLLRDQRTDKTLILCDDRTGAVSDLADGFRELNIPFVYGNVCGDYDSPDDHYTQDADGFRAALAETQRKAIKPDALDDYIKYDMAADIEKLRQDAGRKTGFSNLDAAAGSLYAGFYVGGGLSAIGKTTFYLQLGNQLAESGQHVLFFSLEQSRLEMVAKSISCRTAIDGDGVEAGQIRQGAKGENIDRAFKEYAAAVGDRISVIEGNFNCTVPYIERYTRDYIQRNHVRPVVIVDYLQILGAALDPETHRKQTDARLVVNDNVTALKRISRSLSIPVIAVSSMNRANYLTPIDFESFKESGTIEYTADVVWGLQLAAIHEDIFCSDPKKDVIKKRERISTAKNSNPREVELVCIKNRYGRNYNCLFKYYPQYDYFVPDDGFRSAGETPFDNLPLN